MVMPLFPRKGAALAGGAFTVMACEITESFVAGVGPRRRLLGVGRVLVVQVLGFGFWAGTLGTGKHIGKKVRSQHLRIRDIW